MSSHCVLTHHILVPSITTYVFFNNFKSAINCSINLLFGFSCIWSNRVEDRRPLRGETFRLVPCNRYPHYKTQIYWWQSLQQHQYSITRTSQYFMMRCMMCIEGRFKKKLIRFDNSTQYRYSVLWYHQNTKTVTFSLVVWGVTLTRPLLSPLSRVVSEKK